MSQVKKIPDGYHSITPYLIVKNGSEAIEYYKKIFGAKEHGRMMTPDGKRIAHAEIEIGNSKLMLADEFPEMNSLSPKTIGGSPVGLFLYVDDVDKVFSQAVAEGAKVLMRVEDQFWGDRYGSIEDPFGHRWSISTHIKDLTEEELKKAAAEAFAKMPENKPN
jgi:PhnB protein